jgi:hypothetical protein
MPAFLNLFGQNLFSPSGIINLIRFRNFVLSYKSPLGDKTKTNGNNSLKTPKISLDKFLSKISS